MWISLVSRAREDRQSISGSWGLGKDKWHLEIAEIGRREIGSDNTHQDAGEIAYLRERLMQTLQRQSNVGGFKRAHVSTGKMLKDLRAAECTRAIQSEYALMLEPNIRPSMSRASVKRFAANNEQIMLDLKLADRLIKMWEAIRYLLQHQRTRFQGASRSKRSGHGLRHQANLPAVAQVKHDTRIAHARHQSRRQFADRHR